MRKSLALRYGLRWTEDQSTIVGFGATAVTTVIGKVTITAEVDEATLDDVTVYVVPDASSPHDFLVGRPWCEAPEISYIKYNKTLTFYNTTAFPFLVNGAEPAAGEMDGLTTCETTKLEPRHVTLVTARVNGHAVQVPVGNCTDQDVVVQANQVLARRAVMKFVPPNDSAPFE